MKLASRVAGITRSLLGKRPRLGVGVAVAMAVAPFGLWGQTPAWVPNGSNLYVPAGTSVGIGTASPDKELSFGITGVNSGIYNSYFTTEQSGFAWYLPQMAANNYARTLDIVAVGSKSGAGGGSEIRFLTNPNSTNTAVARMLINNAGNVGIGTTTPTYKLDVQGGQINSSGGYCINGANCITSWPAGGGGSGTVTSVTAGSGLSGGTISSSGTLSLNLGSANAWTAAQTFGANTNFPGGVWNASGNVGIGTTTPSYALDVQGVSGSNNSGRFYSTVDSLAYLDNFGMGPSPNDGADIRLVTLNAAGSPYAIVDLVKYKFGGFFINNSEPSTAGFTAFGLGGVERMRIANSGNVGIGTTNPQYPLSVNGTIQAKEVRVNTGWSDYVFAPNYRLQPLSEVASFIQTNRHLPGIPPAQEVEAKGVNLGEMQSKLLAKVEELTLHMIEAERENRELRERIARLEAGQARH